MPGFMDWDGRRGVVKNGKAIYHDAPSRKYWWGKDIRDQELYDRMGDLESKIGELEENIGKVWCGNDIGWKTPPQVIQMIIDYLGVDFSYKQPVGGKTRLVKKKE